jgi:hypothetical protein
MAKHTLIFIVLWFVCSSSLVPALTMGRAGGLKVMIVGNSISHGYQGDYTWRYRIWQWSRDNSLPIQFVGPYTGTNPPDDPLPPQPPPLLGEHPSPTPPKTWGTYAKDVDEAFLSECNHFSVWGRQVAQDMSLIRDQVSEYQPDILLVELGFNDMGWFVSGPDGTLHNMKAFIDNARSAKSSIKMAIANVPQRSFMIGREDLVRNTLAYNTNLSKSLEQWTAENSQLELVDLQAHYDCE